MELARTIFLLLFLFSDNVNSYKFLFYSPVSPGVSPSHRLFIDKLADLLVDSGHNVTNFMPTMIDHNEGDKKRKSTVLPWKSSVSLNFTSNHNFIDVWNLNESIFDYDLGSLTEMYKPFAQLCNVLINDDEIIEKLREEKFDLGLTENFDPCGFVLFKKLGIKYAPVFSTTPNNFHLEMLGIPSPSSFIPGFLTPFINPSSFFDRFLNEITDYYSEKTLKHAQIETIVEGQGYGSYKELLGESQVVFINSDEYIEYSRPVSQKIVFIGGFGLDRIKNVNKNTNIEKVLDRSSQTVLVSFGAYVNSSAMPLSLKESFAETFARFPNTTFIWRYQTPEDPFAQKLKPMKNVVLQKWVPQMQILSHSNIRAFLSHCGMNSLSEATYFGVPMICVPFFGDQKRNIKMLEQRGIGIEITKKEINKENLVKVFSEILNSERYYSKAQQLSKLIRAKPLGPTERFIKYSELAAGFDILHEVTDLPGRQLNILQYYNLDVIVVIVIIIGLILLLSFKVVRLFVKHFIPSNQIYKVKVK